MNEAKQLEVHAAIHAALTKIQNRYESLDDENLRHLVADETKIVFDAIKPFLDETPAFTPTPHEPLPGVTLWNTGSESAANPKVTLAGIKVDGAIAGVVVDGNARDARDIKESFTSRGHPRTAPLANLDLTKLAEFAAKVRADRKAAETPKPETRTPLTLETWPNTPVYVRIIEDGVNPFKTVPEVGRDNVYIGNWAYPFDSAAAKLEFVTDAGEFPCTVEGLAAMRKARGVA